MNTRQLIQKNFSFDAGHRIVNHKGLCGNIHGHEWNGTLSFSYESDTMEDTELGYSFNFTKIN